MPSMKNRHPDAALIDAIGPKVVTSAYGIKPMNLYTWRVRGVPERYKVSFARLAATNGVAVPSDFFAGMIL